MARDGSTVLAQVRERGEKLRGRVFEETLGTVTVKDFCRYAVAVGDDDYAARARAEDARGREVAAPPLFLTGVLGWADGPAEAELRPDGLAERESPCTEGLAVSQVHGGQRVDVIRPPPAGSVLGARRELVDVAHKQGRSGELVILRMRTEFHDAAGTPLTTSVESIVVRPATPESPTAPPSASPPSGRLAMTWTPSRLRLFRFSAVSWNSHRVHYDLEHANAEGFPDVLVQSTLHGEMLARAALSTTEGRRLTAVEWRNLAPAYAGRPLRYHVQRTSEGRFDVTATDPADRPCATARVATASEAP